MEKMGNEMAGQMKDGMDRMLKMTMELRSSLSAEMSRELDKRDQQMEQRFGRRVMRSQLGLNRDGTQYFANCTTRAQVLLVADMLAQEKHNAEGLTGEDPSVLSKCLSILCKTNKRSTDDEVAKQVAIHNLQINKKSARAYAFGQKFNSCAIQGQGRGATREVRGG